MFKDLENLLDLENLDSLAAPFVFAKNYKVDGSFLIHHLLSYAFRHEYVVFFVHSYQTLSHYKSVQVKLGNSQVFNKNIEQGRFVSFDLLKLAEARLTQTNSGQSPTLSAEILDFFKQKVATKSNEGSKFLVMFDDLSVLNLIGYASNKQLTDLVHSFQQILTRQDGRQQNLLVFNTQEFDDHEASELTPAFLMQMAHLADIYIDVSHLTTGYLKEINGQMKVFKKNHPLDVQVQSFLFKISERNVQLQPIAN